MSEKDLQILVCNYLALRKDVLVHFMVPNGVKLSGGASYYNSLVRQGFKTGVSDLIIVLKNKILFLELKVGANKQSENQVIFQKIINKCDVGDYHIIRSLGDLEELLNATI